MDCKTAERLTAKALRVCAMNVATTRAFLGVLSSKLIQWDKRQARSELKRGGRVNIYRMGLLLQALNKVRDDMEKAGVMDDDTPEAMKVLKQSLGVRFTENFSPVKATLKTIDAWLDKGKLPRYG